MRYRVICFQCLCYLALPLCIVSRPPMHLTRCAPGYAVCIFSIVLLNFLFLKLQFMRIKMYILAPPLVLTVEYRAGRRADSVAGQGRRLARFIRCDSVKRLRYVTHDVTRSRRNCSSAPATDRCAAPTLRIPIRHQSTIPLQLMRPCPV